MTQMVSPSNARLACAARANACHCDGGRGERADGADHHPRMCSGELVQDLFQGSRQDARLPVQPVGEALQARAISPDQRQGDPRFVQVGGGQASGPPARPQRPCFTGAGSAETTVPQITARAGLTTRTFFRHFTDKREVLFAAEQGLPGLISP